MPFCNFKGNIIPKPCFSVYFQRYLSNRKLFEAPNPAHHRKRKTCCAVKVVCYINNVKQGKWTISILSFRQPIYVLYFCGSTKGIRRKRVNVSIPFCRSYSPNTENQARQSTVVRIAWNFIRIAYDRIAWLTLRTEFSGVEGI